VRVIRFDDSVELCGGTHVHHTGQIGFFKIMSESSIAAGIRRIEAITGEKVVEYVFSQIQELAEVKSLLKNQKNAAEGVRALIEEVNSLNKKVDDLIAEQAQVIKKNLIQRKENINGINFIAAKIELNSASAIKDISYQLKNEVDNLFLALGAEIDGKANLSVMISENLVKEKSWNASVIIREIAKEIQGGGGGQDFYATAGGKNPKGIDNALVKVKEYLV